MRVPTFIAFRAAARASLFQPTILSPIHKCHIPRTAPVLMRYATSQAGSGQMRNNEIPYYIVQLVNEEGRLNPPTPLSHIIASIDSKTQFVELVSENPQPIVKIKSKKAEYDKMKEKKKRQKEVAASNVQKEIQMSWGVESGDLAHKLKKVRKDLEKGARVDLVYASKANQAKPSPAAMEKRIDQTLEMLSDIAKEWAPRKVDNGVAVLFLKLTDKPKPTERS